MDFIALRKEHDLALPPRLREVFSVKELFAPVGETELAAAFLSERFHLAEGTATVFFRFDSPRAGSFSLEQIHSADVHWIHPGQSPERSPKGDGWVTCYESKKFANTAITLSVRTADCLPVAMVSSVGERTWAALVHAGWRGYCAGIHFFALEQLLQNAANFGVERPEFLNNLEVFVGPAIFGRSYECGPDVAEAVARHWNERVATKPHAAKVAALHAECANALWVGGTGGIESGAAKGSRNKVFPDFQLLMCCDMVAAGVSDGRIRVLRENTFGSQFLCSYRHATLNGGETNRRLVTHLALGP